MSKKVTFSENVAAYRTPAEVAAARHGGLGLTVGAAAQRWGTYARELVTGSGWRTYNAWKDYQNQYNGPDIHRLTISGNLPGGASKNNMRGKGTRRTTARKSARKGMSNKRSSKRSKQSSKKLTVVKMKSYRGGRKRPMARSFVDTRVPVHTFIKTGSTTSSAKSAQQIATQWALLDNPDMKTLYDKLSYNTGEYDANIQLVSSQKQVTATNNSTFPVVGCVYIVKLRFDSIKNPFQAWEDGVTTNGAHATPGVPAGSVYVPGVTPYHSHLFTRLCQVTKQFGFHLRPGENRVWTFSGYKGIINATRLGYLNTTGGTRKYAKYILLTAKGQPVVDSEGALGAFSAPVRLDFLQKETYSYKVLPYARPHITYSNSNIRAGGIPGYGATVTGEIVKGDVAPNMAVQFANVIETEQDFIENVLPFNIDLDGDDEPDVGQMEDPQPDED